MTDKVKFIVRVTCFDTNGKMCYFSKRTLCNRSVYDILDSFEFSIIPRVSRRLPEGSSVLHATLSLYDVDNPISDCSPNYSFVIHF